MVVTETLSVLMYAPCFRFTNDGVALGMQLGDMHMLEGVTEITGYLLIESQHLSHLGFLSRLEVIGGQNLHLG